MGSQLNGDKYTMFVDQLNQLPFKYNSLSAQFHLQGLFVSQQLN